ncbi:hypothetical protein K7432_016929, partial [Basidiobolus ranarum]
SIAGVGGGLVFTAVFQSLKDTHGPKSPVLYSTNVYWILAFVVVGLILCYFVHVTIQDCLFPAVPGQIICFRAFGKIVRLVEGKNGMRFEKWSREQEHAEWTQYLNQRSS